MGREGFEPSTLGLRVAAEEFGRRRDYSRSRIIEPNQLVWLCVRSELLVDPALTTHRDLYREEATALRIPKSGPGLGDAHLWEPGPLKSA
jgi:hypothetical protein